MQKKSLIVTILSLIVAFIAAYTNSLTEHLQAILGLVSFTATAVLTTFFPSGTFAGFGWKIGYYIVLIGGILTQLAQLLATSGLGVSAEIINYVVLGIAVIINEFGRTYNKV